MKRKFPTIVVSMSILMGALSCGVQDEQLEEADKTTQALSTTQAESGLPIAKLSDEVRPEHYHLSLKIDPTQERFSGSVGIEVTLSKPTSLIWLHGNGLEVTHVNLETTSGSQIEATYKEVHSSGVARLDLASPAPAGKAVLHFKFSAAFDLSLAGLFRIDQGDVSYALTQFQSTSARMAFPSFDDPAFKVPFDISILSRTIDVAVTNTPEISAEHTEDGWTLHKYHTTRPLPTYLLAFAVGPYDLVEGKPIPASGIRSTPLPLRALSAKGKGGDLTFALDHTNSLVTVLENYFEIPFPYAKLDSIAAPDFFGGAMENAGAIIAHETLLVVDDKASLNQRRASVATHAHEIAHQWFGDLVTPVWWDDIWLNESFATWMGNKASDIYWPEGGFARGNLTGALWAMTSDSLDSARQIRQPIERNADIDNAFDSITYEKGGGVLAMFENFLGEEAFRKGVQTHLIKYADSVASSEDFLTSLAEGSGRPDVVPAFRSFIDQPGVPLVKVSLDCADPTSPKLNIWQDRYRPLGSPIEGDSKWIIPLRVAYQVNGERRVVQKLIRELEETIELEAASCPTVLMPNADGSGYYRFTLDEAGWADLTSNTEFMNAEEALVYADSLVASFRAGKSSAQAMIQGLHPLAMHSDWEVAGSVADLLEDLTGQILEGDALGIARSKMSAMFRPRYEALLESESEQDLLLKVKLTRFLGVVSMDPEIRSEMVRQATLRIGLEGPADPSVVSDDLLETVLSVGVQELGTPFLLELLKQAKASDDQAFRSRSFGALARVEDPKLAERLQAEFVSSDLNSNEKLGLILRQLARPATRDATWDWLQGDFGSVLNSLPGGPFAGQFVGMIGSQLCEREHSAEIEVLVNQYADQLPGFERGLAQSMEKVSLCVTLRDTRHLELLAAFHDLKSDNTSH